MKSDPFFMEIEKDTSPSCHLPQETRPKYTFVGGSVVVKISLIRSAISCEGGIGG